MRIAAVRSGAAAMVARDRLVQAGAMGEGIA